MFSLSSKVETRPLPRHHTRKRSSVCPTAPGPPDIPLRSPLHLLKLLCVPPEGRVISRGPSYPSPLRYPGSHSLVSPIPCHGFHVQHTNTARCVNLTPSPTPLASLSSLSPSLPNPFLSSPSSYALSPHSGGVGVRFPRSVSSSCCLLPSLRITPFCQASACMGRSHPLLHWVWLKAMARKHPWTSLCPLRRESQEEQVSCQMFY